MVAGGWLHSTRRLLCSYIKRACERANSHCATRREGGLASPPPPQTWCCIVFSSEPVRAVPRSARPPTPIIQPRVSEIEVAIPGAAIIIPVECAAGRRGGCSSLGIRPP